MASNLDQKWVIKSILMSNSYFFQIKMIQRTIKIFGILKGQINLKPLLEKSIILFLYI